MLYCTIDNPPEDYRADENLSTFFPGLCFLLLLKILLKIQKSQGFIQCLCSFRSGLLIWIEKKPRLSWSDAL